MSANLAAFWRRPACFWQVVLAAVAGNLAVHQLPALPGPGPLLVAVILALALLATIGFCRGSLVAIAILLGAWTATDARLSLADRWPGTLDGTDIAIAGWVDELPRIEPGRTVFSLRVTEADGAVAPGRVRLSWYEPPEEIRAGQSLRVVARLRAPRGLANPGGYDYERWLFVEGYGATGYVRQGEVFPTHPREARRAWLSYRAGLVDRILALDADRDGVALLAALGLGERTGFEDRHWNVLQRTGTSHLVAVSGLHIGLVAALAYALILRGALCFPYRYACRAHMLAAVGCIAPAVTYAALAGFALPTRRAVIMVLVAQLVVLTGRRWAWPMGLSMALGLLLVLDPLSSLTASFWLSFGAVAVLLAAGRDDRAAAAGVLRRQLRRLVVFGRLQLALTLGLLPLTIWYFSQFSAASLVVNLVAIPVFGLLAVPLSLLAVVMLMLGSDGPGLPLLAAAVLGWLWDGLEFAASSRFAAFEIARPQLTIFLLALGAIVMALPGHRLPGRLLALVGLLPLANSPDTKPQPGDVRMTVLEVGHGLAAVVETAHQRLLFDSGPSYPSGFNAGTEVVAPAIAALGSGPVDILVISHGDADHSGGAAALIERFPDVRVLAGPDVETGRAEPCQDGLEWQLDGVTFTFLHPPADYFLRGNDSSCVLRVATAGGRILLTGDIEYIAEQRLAQRADLRAEVVVIPHHGSQTSSSDEFVAAVGARLAVASAAFNNRWGFPREEVRQRWQDAGAIVVGTGDAGAISVEVGPNSIEYTAARERQRYWHPERAAVSGAIAPTAL